ncbi:hypothetical protein GQ42DRAFT_71932 [Ramicandelaber brevisporus]|nr:hypothetical protein GQ42DRAFT_71932 [Ramicandelaber brevisporus]
MLPKRRRTITTLSTVLDSLRAKIHHFADTAADEQLREVAQLIDRLSISNSGPFRLLDLPYELLEYTAERYFTRGEAVPVLPVNRVFNELFANRVWKSIGFNNMKMNGCIVSQDVLMKNARRIRSVNLWSITPDFFVSGYFQYATSITFRVEKDMETMFTFHLEQMKYLRRVTLIPGTESHSFIDTATKWINDSHRSGHVQQVVIDASQFLDDQQSNHLLASLMDKIKFKKRIRLDCGSLQLFPNSIIQFMPIILTQLNIAEGLPKRCYGKVNKQVFNTNPDSVFIHLRSLCIQVCCSNSSLYNFQSFVPERFPFLSYLTMCVPEQCCNGDIDTPLATIFSSKQWPSIMDFELGGNETRMPEAGRLLLRAMPTLWRCTFRNMAEIDMSSDLNTCLTISELYLIKTTLSTINLRSKPACLVYLELDNLDIDLNHLQLIASCRRLVDIELTNCGITDDAIAAVSKYPCNSVHAATFSEYEDGAPTDRIAHLLLAFPNLRILDLAGVDEGNQMDFILKCPVVKIFT